MSSVTTVTGMFFPPEPPGSQDFLGATTILSIGTSLIPFNLSADVEGNSGRKLNELQKPVSPSFISGVRLALAEGMSAAANPG